MGFHPTHSPALVGNVVKALHHALALAHAVWIEGESPGANTTLWCSFPCMNLTPPRDVSASSAGSFRLQWRPLFVRPVTVPGQTDFTQMSRRQNFDAGLLLTPAHQNVDASVKQSDVALPMDSRTVSTPGEPRAPGSTLRSRLFSFGFSVIS